jgi:toxin YoeB
MYELEFTPQADKDIADFKKSNFEAYVKAQKLFFELMEHPYTGTGKPERMKYIGSGI